MIFEGLAGTGIGGRTPLMGWGGVQIWGVGRIGRQLGVGAASRFGLESGMDAICKRRRRPDQGWSADWTPFGCWRGVQIAVVGRNGRQLGVGVASRFGLYGGMDATYGLGRRPDSW